jgi:hypothetical protein
MWCSKCIVLFCGGHMRCSAASELFCFVVVICGAAASVLFCLGVYSVMVVGSDG